MHLIQTTRTDPLLLEVMQKHYSQPKGFVGRNICYAVWHNNKYYGHIVGGSTPRYLPGREAFYKIVHVDDLDLNSIVCNLFYHVEKVDNKYPFRNFTIKILKEFMKQCSRDWFERYNNKVTAFEALVELPRTGEIYKRSGFSYLGTTHGYGCKRPGTSSHGRTDSYTGMRVWDTVNLRPKLVFGKFVSA